MTEVSETQLPGVGVRLEFTAADQTRVGVVVHRNGRREVVQSDARDPDRCTPLLTLNGDDARTLAELLGGSQVQEVTQAVTQQVEGLSIEWMTVSAESDYVGRSIAEGQFRTRTGASIVAVLRGGSTIPAPEPTHTFEAGEVVVAVGTGDGLAQLEALLAP